MPNSLSYKDVISFLFGALLIYFVRDISQDFEGVKLELTKTRETIVDLNTTMAKVVTDQSNMKEKDKDIDVRIRVLESFHRKP